MISYLPKMPGARNPSEKEVQLSKSFRELLCPVLVWWLHVLGEDVADAAIVALLALWH
jgi:hypothetical protein